MHEAFRSVHSLSLIVSFMQLFSLFLAKKRLKYNITFDLTFKTIRNHLKNSSSEELIKSIIEINDHPTSSTYSKKKKKKKVTPFNPSAASYSTPRVLP